MNQIGSLMSVFFTDQKVRDFESAVTSNTEQYADYFGYLLDRGIYIAPSQFETMFISDAIWTSRNRLQKCRSCRS